MNSTATIAAGKIDELESMFSTVVFWDTPDLVKCKNAIPPLIARIRELEDGLDNMEIGQFRGEWLQEANRKWETREEDQMPELLWVCRCRELLMAMQQAHGILAAKGGA